MAVGRLFGKDTKGAREKIDYIRTLSHDGRKEVNFDKFFMRPVVKNQIKRLREEIIEPQRSRTQR